MNLALLRPAPVTKHPGYSKIWLTLLFFAILAPAHLHAEEKQAEGYDTSQQPWAIVMTNKGTFVIQLFEDKVPRTVRHFVGLATGDKATVDPKTKKKTNRAFYDGLQIFKIVPTYLLKMGCPKNRGTHGSGYQIKDEFHPSLNHNQKGMVSMANAGPHTNSSQFFIALRPTPWLNAKTLKGTYCQNFTLPIKCRSNKDCRRFAKQYPKGSQGSPTCKTRVIQRGHTVFGKVIYGMKVLETISELPVTSSGTPIQPVTLQRVHIRRAKRWKRKWLRLPKTAE